MFQATVAAAPTATTETISKKSSKSRYVFLLYEMSRHVFLLYEIHSFLFAFYVDFDRNP